MRHLGGMCFLTDDWKEISHGKSPCKQDCILVFLKFVGICNVNVEEIYLYSMMLNP